MASQIFSTRVNSKSSQAFTLVEVMVGAALSSLVLAGVLSTFLLMGKTGTRLAYYTDAEASARKALEQFSREAHQAYSVESYSSTSVTLGMPDNTTNRIPGNPKASGAYLVTYKFENNKLIRQVDSAGDSVPELEEILVGDREDSDADVIRVEQIPSTPFISYYKYVTAGTNPPAGSGYQDAVGTNTAGSVGEINQVEFSFLINRKNVTVATTSNKVVSARFILRNK